MITLQNGDVLVSVDPLRGGGITRFCWRDFDLFRPALAGDPSPLGLSSFVLVPYSNRIENGNFEWQGRQFTIAPNMPGGGSPHPQHGTGWTAPWSVVFSAKDRLILNHDHEGQDWPSAYRASQEFQLLPRGFRHRLSLLNTGTSAMPAGMGFHPYFPRAAAQLDAGFDGVWQTSTDGLPTIWAPLPTMPQWFDAGTIDAVFTGRHGPVKIEWPTHSVTIHPSAGLDFTTVYCPAGEDYFCVEPVSHMTNALNHHARPASGQRLIKAGESWTVWADFLA